MKNPRRVSPCQNSRTCDPTLPLPSIGGRQPTILEPPPLASLQPPAAGWKVAGDPGINTKRQRRMACPAAHQQPMEIQDPNGTPSTENVRCAYRRFHVCISWCIFTLVSICYIMGGMDSFICSIDWSTSLRVYLSIYLSANLLSLPIQVWFSPVRSSLANRIISNHI